MRLPERLLGRAVHAFTASLTLLGAYWLVSGYPELTRDIPAKFATWTGLATLYGVAFAVIETFRAKSAARYASERADRAAKQVHAAYGIRDLTECQNFIETALQVVEEQNRFPLATLVRIGKLYTAEFADEYEIETSEVRMRVAMLESYALQHRPNRPGPPHKVKEALMAMAIQLSASATKRMNLETIE